MDDHQLLKEYAETGSEAAFAQLVERHLGLVYGAARRQVSDPSLAADVSQAVFLLLARKAQTLSRSGVLAGWLIRTTRFVASRAVRSEQRRQHREQQALAMQDLNSSEDVWERLAPELDEALASLGGTDRHALLLRFGEGRSHREVGSALGLPEEAAKKRTQRALEKLRALFGRRGLTLTAVGLAAGLGERLVAAPPPGLKERVIRHSTLGAVPADGPGQLAHGVLSSWRRRQFLWSGGVAVLLLGLIGGGFLRSGARDSTEAAAPRDASSPALVAEVPTSPEERTASQTGFRLVVLAAESGEPIAGAPVPVNTVVGHEWIRRDDLVTDEDGVCIVPLPAEPVGRLDVGVNAPGWVPRFFTWRVDQDEPLPNGHTLRLSPAISLSGTALDPARRPVRGVEVWATFGGTGDSTAREPVRERLGFVGELRFATTDAEGRWSCRQVPAGYSDFSLRFRHPDFVDSSVGGFEGSQSNTDELQRLRAQTAEVTMQPGAVAWGTVVDARGQPVVGARVGQAWYPPEAVTAADGAFVLRPLKPGLVHLLATAEGFAPKPFALTAGGAPEVIALEPGGNLQVRLVDEAGEPVAGGNLVLDRWPGSDLLGWRGVSDEDGWIVWSGAPRDERMVFTAMAPGFVYARDLALRSDGPDQTLTLRRVPKATGRVVDAETGKPIPLFKAIPGFGSEFPNYDRSELRRGSDGTYLLPFSEAGGAWVRIESEGYQTMEARLQPGTNGEPRADFEMRRQDGSQGVRGVVVNADGTPAAGIQVALCASEHGAMLGKGAFRPYGTPLLTNTDAAGRFAYPWVATPHTVAAVSAGGFGQVRVRNHQEARVSLEPFGRIEGVVSREGQPVSGQDVVLGWNLPGVRLRTVSLDLRSFQTQTDANGRFSLEWVPAGDASLFLNHGVGIPFTDQTPVTIAAGETLEVVMGEFAADAREVHGRLQVSEPDRVKDWKLQARHSTLSRVEPATPPPAHLSAEEQALWELDRSESAEERARARKVWSYPLEVGADGSYLVRGVAAGKYLLMVQLHPAGPGGEESRAPRYGEWIGTARLELEVPTRNAEEDPRLDMGEVTIPLKPRK